MQPGLSRAVPLGILGFLIGAALLVLIRALQSLDPVFDPQLAIVLGAVFCAGLFIWGLGALDPRLNEHAHEPAEGEAHAIVEVEEHAKEAESTPWQIVSGYGWLITTLLLILILVLAAFAFLPTGLTLQTVNQPEGNMAALGFYEIPIFGQTLVFSELITLFIFVAVMMISLVALGGALGLVFFSLSRGVTEVSAVEQTQLPPPSPAQAQPTMLSRLLTAVLILVVFLILFALFYYVLIGIIIGPGPLNFVLSAGQALPLAFLIVQPRATIRVIGRAAGWLARQLRRVPNGIQ